MPTRRKPELAHRSLNYAEVFQHFHEKLLARQKVVLDRSGFFNEFGTLGEASYTGEQPAAELIVELAALLATALTIRVDAGFKAPSKVIATLEAIIRDPELALSDWTEPEARGALAALYQRADEQPGKYWFDIYGDGGFEPDQGRIRAAAEAAIVGLRAQAKQGRLIAHDVRHLALRLRQIFLRFNDKITRKSVISSRRDGKLYQSEAGSFFAFVEEVLGPLRRFLAALPNGGELLVPELSAEYIARLATAEQPSSRRAHLSP